MHLQSDRNGDSAEQTSNAGAEGIHHQIAINGLDEQDLRNFGISHV